MNTTNSILSRIVDGNRVEYIPKDINGVDIFIGSSVEMPEPNDTDVWNHGNFVATVEDCDERTGDLLVIDSDGDWFCVEPNRIRVVSE